MRLVVIAATIGSIGVPAAAVPDVSGHIQVLTQDQSDFDIANSFAFGTITSSAAAAPSSATFTASAANGGSLSASFTGHSFGYVSGFLNYQISVVGPSGAPVPVLIDTMASLTATGDMASFASLRIGSLYANGGGGPFGGGESPDYPLVLNASLCSGAEAPCIPDTEPAGWSLTGMTIYLLPNRIYPVALAVTVQQRDYNSSGILGNGAGTAFVDPVFHLAPGVTGYTLSNTLSVPEPQTWALLLVGFGLTGTALRRRIVA